MKNCIGLFGTCGNSKWRDKFIWEFEANNIDYFNPLNDDWKPEDAIIEADHLANDSIILFPITHETYGTGSLAETGFSILQAIRLEERRDFVIMISPTLAEELMVNAELAKESLRARALVIQHLKKLNLSNVYFVNTLTEMFYVSLTLWKSNLEKEKIKEFSITNCK